MADQSSKDTAKDGSVTSLKEIGKGFDRTLLQQLFEDRAQLGPDVLKDPKYNSVLNPFENTWIFGYNVKVPVFNLFVKNYREVIYVASNMGVIYDCCNKEMKLLKAHQHKIISASIDNSRRWLATADDGEEPIIIIWDAVWHKLILTIFHPVECGKILLIAMSPSAKNLVVACENDVAEMTLLVWQWTYGRDAPDEIYTYVQSVERAVLKSIQFDPNNERHLMFVFDKEVTFVSVDTVSGMIMEQPLQLPIGNVQKFGLATCGTYVKNAHECFVGTDKGFVLLYGCTIYKKPWVDEEELNNAKMYINSTKMSKHGITAMNSVDEYLVIADRKGIIQVFTKTLQLLYWIIPQEHVHILNMSFQRDPRKYKIDTSVITLDSSCDSSYYSKLGCDQDRTDEYEILMAKDVPLDASLKNEAIVMRDLVISTAEGSIYSVNMLTRKYTPLFGKIDSDVVAIDVHQGFHYLLVASENGLLSLYNYESKEELTRTVLPTARIKDPDTQEVKEVKISTIRYSPNCLHLACGRDNGELWLLQPVILKPLYPCSHRHTKSKILQIEFSPDNLQMIYYDDKSTVCGFVYDAEQNRWIYRNKIRPHYKQIQNILYATEKPIGFYSIGADRNLIYYGDLLNDDQNISVVTRDRVEQMDVPLYFISHPKKGNSSYFLITDDKHKYKLINARTAMCMNVSLGPAYGCYQGSPVTKMEFLPESNERYMIFRNKKHIGIQLMPINGNPYKFIGCLGHPTELIDFRISVDGSYLFTIGKESRCIMMWKICPSSVDILHYLGGDELTPFYCILENGKSGMLFQEMQDLFYFIQILQQGEDTVMPRIITNTIDIKKLPDLLRGCGFYPTDFEIENIITDIRYRDYDDDGTLRDKITFSEFVKLFINHKPAYGYQMETFQKAWNIFTRFGKGELERDDFVDAITAATGEMFTRESAFKCLRTLMGTTDTFSVHFQDDFEFLPEKIGFNELLTDILGISLNATDSILDVKEPASEEEICY